MGRNAALQCANGDKSGPKWRTLFVLTGLVETKATPNETDSCADQGWITSVAGFTAGIEAAFSGETLYEHT